MFGSAAAMLCVGTYTKMLRFRSSALRSAMWNNLFHLFRNKLFHGTTRSERQFFYRNLQQPEIVKDS